MDILRTQIEHSIVSAGHHLATQETHFLGERKECLPYQPQSLNSLNEKLRCFIDRDGVMSPDQILVKVADFLVMFEYLMGFLYRFFGVS